MYKYPKALLDKEGLFGPTTKGHKYKPVSYHNKSAKTKADKNKWRLKQNEQFEVFRLASEGDWYCHRNNCFFSVLDNANEILGLNYERIGYFEPPVNNIDPWHGYPVKSCDYNISEDMLDLWVDNNIINMRTRIKIGKGLL